MKLTQEQIESNKHITTETIKKDITDTQKEIEDYRDERKVLARNPQENKVRLYMLDGKISKRIHFVEFLKALLEVRKEL